MERPGSLLGSSMIILKFIHVGAQISNSFFSVVEQYSIVWIDNNLLIQSPVGGVGEIKQQDQREDPPYKQTTREHLLLPY